MSFSSEVRNELARVMPGKQCCRKAELSALFAINGAVSKNDDGSRSLKGTAENAATARKIFTLLKEAYHLQSSVKIVEQKRFNKKKNYEVDTRLRQDNFWIARELNIMESDVNIKPEINSSLLAKSYCKRAYLRGIFLSRGSINRPEGEYHLEFVLNDARIAAFIQKILDKFKLDARMVERKNHLVVYIKDSEKIVDFLRIVGASRALLDFENVRIIKSMRNNVNRQVNCETANLAKTVNASVRQIELIERLIQRTGMKGLPRQLRELAELRIDYPDASLQELGTMLDPPLSKSGVAYRMRKLESMADDSDMLD